jgi:hypothetical protein
MSCASRAVGAPSAALPRERVGSHTHLFLTLSKATSSTVSSAEALPCAKWFTFVELVRHVVTQQFCVSLSTNPPRLVACSNRTAGSVADILT